MEMDKYVWHSVRDELPPAGSPLLILATEHQFRDEDGDVNEDWTEKDIRFGYYDPMYKYAWRDEYDESIHTDEDFKITHWMFAPDMPED
jgi:hypothetical protein